MLTRIQIRAEGPTAHEAEGELRWAAARIIDDFGLSGDLTEQVIEGTPGRTFTGRVSLSITEQPTKDHGVVTLTYTPEFGVSP